MKSILFIIPVIDIDEHYYKKDFYVAVVIKKKCNDPDFYNSWFITHWNEET